VPTSLKHRIKKTPGVGPLAVRVKRMLADARFTDSADHWERRYAKGGNSGVGSYGALAEYKARVLNEFVVNSGARSVIEFGCGDGNQLTLAQYPQYLGFDVSKTAIDLCINKFRDDPTKSFLWYEPARFANRGAITADLTLSLDVIFHLVEDEVFQSYLVDLFGAATGNVIIYSSNYEMREAPHVRHRQFTTWVANHLSEWRLSNTLENPHKGLVGAAADFHIYERV
jgi:SAM-dependent methyltransferase